MSDGGFHTLSPSFSKNFGIYPFANVNHNVVINIGMKFFFGLSDGIWSGTVLANYLFHIGGNEYAGYAEAAMGIASLVVALPAGWAADRGSKARVIAIGGLGVPLAVALTSFAVIWSYDHTSEKVTSFWIFVAALSLWGACQSVANGPAQALYAVGRAFTLLQLLVQLVHGRERPRSDHLDHSLPRAQRHVGARGAAQRLPRRAGPLSPRRRRDALL